MFFECPGGVVIMIAAVRLNAFVSDALVHPETPCRPICFPKPSRLLATLTESLFFVAFRSWFPCKTLHGLGSLTHLFSPATRSFQPTSGVRQPA